MKPEDLESARGSSHERQRTADLLRMMPREGLRALDIGARDGFFAGLMAERFEAVVALDLKLPGIAHPKVQCVAADAADMPFEDGSFDFVLCAEVLEHIPRPTLEAVCRDMARVTHPQRGQVLIGVPYRQDIRIGRLTCRHCGRHSPPWGHVNSFDEAALLGLFPGFQMAELSFVGTNAEQTNALAAGLMDWAGNPHGNYQQIEPCLWCGRPFDAAPERNLVQKVATRLGSWARLPTQARSAVRGNWMHALLTRI